MDRARIARKEILGMGLDDVTGIYEIIWRLNTLWPEIDIGEKYRLAEEALRNLLKQNALRLIRQWDENDQRPTEAIDPDQIDEILRSPVSWYPRLSGNPGWQITYEITEVGEVLYRDLIGKV